MNLVKSLLKKIIPQKVRVALRDKQKRMGNISKPINVFTIKKDENILNCKIAYNKDGAFCLPIASLHRPAVQLILKGKVHEPDTIKFINENCSEGDVIHAGAYFGDLLPALSKGISKEASIWTFEPSYENFRCAEITCKLNNLKNVKLHNAALGNEATKVSFQIEDEKGKNLGGLSKVNVDENSAIKTVKVNQIVIDELIPSTTNISIIHLDVEGYEQQALTGALKTINRCKPIIIVESLPSENWLNENLRPLGYIATEDLHGDTVFTV